MPVPKLILASALAILAASGVADARPTLAGRVIRIRLQPATAVPMPNAAVEWKESRGPKCIPRGAIAAAVVSAPKQVDFILRDRTRQRARLQRSCPALQFYSGFYLKPTGDGFICRDRDAVHDRSGSECQIDAFRKLTPAKPKPGKPTPARAR